MGRVLKTTSGSGGGSGTGLSTSDVNALIEAKSRWEFIKKIDVTSSVSSLRVSDGVDSTKYQGYLYEFEDIRVTSSSYMSWRLRNSSGSSYGVYSIAHNVTSNYASDRWNNASLFYSNGSYQFQPNDGSRMQLRVEVYDRADFIIGYIKTSQGLAGGYWNQHTDGNFLAQKSTASPGDYGEIEAAFPIQSGSVSIYGQRIRSAS